MERDGGGDLELLIYLLIDSNKLTYLQLITVLVYGNSSTKNHEHFRTWKLTKNETLQMIDGMFS